MLHRWAVCPWGRWTLALIIAADACTDRMALNFDPCSHAPGLVSCPARGSCIPASSASGCACHEPVLGCTDNSSVSYDPLANVDDGGCVSGGECAVDLRWGDSDGEGCNQYHLASCGFERSTRMCPSVCGLCSVGSRLGCDGVPGSGAALDACGVCGGDGTSCASCSASLAHRCTRTVSGVAALGAASAAACTQLIAGASTCLLSACVRACRLLMCRWPQGGVGMRW
jgi:hypothetical protein